MLFFVFIAVALILVGLEVFCYKQNKKSYSNNNLGQKWNFIYKWRWIFGIIFALISMIIKYPMFGTTNTIIGFPLIVAVFDKYGTDYVGITTIPFAIINSIICFFVVEIILYIWSKIIKNGSKSSF